MSAVLPPQLVQRADSFLDTDAQHQAAIELGELFYSTFEPDKEGRISSQVRNLQQIAVSATRFADIEDFVKNQMGRKAGAYREWRKVGEQTLKQLKGLREAASQLAEDEGVRLQLRLRLARGWVRAVVGGYLYAKALKEIGEGHA